MSEQQYRFVLEAKSRDDQGKGASRRLRRAGFVPAIVYGGNEQPLSISLSQNDLVKFGQQDSFYSQIILLKVAGLPDQEVLVRDVQRHLFKPLYQHIDFQRIVRGQEISATVAIKLI
uniref:50S ribosomal protein L25 n=1 Tax=Mesomycoplasma ovipneumoniae TaxID=29562 RepID=UPI0030803967